MHLATGYQQLSAAAWVSSFSLQKQRFVLALDWPAEAQDGESKTEVAEANRTRETQHGMLLNSQACSAWQK